MANVEDIVCQSKCSKSIKGGETDLIDMRKEKEEQRTSGQKMRQVETNEKKMEHGRG